MWTRKELKMKGRISMNRNYWRTMLISFILMLLGSGGAAGGRGANLSYNIGSSGGGDITQTVPGSDLPFPIPDAGSSGAADIGGMFRDAFGNVPVAALIAGTIAVLLVVLVVVAIGLAVRAFLGNPLELGGRRFFLTNLNRSAEVRELGFAFDHSYMNIVKTLFLRDIFLILWSLLLVIPGIVKAYEYRMIPYILAENPGMDTREAFTRSRDMMYGQKWKTFVLDLSFMGWELLSLLTVGLLHIFYVAPYRNMTEAALYEALAYGNRMSDDTVWVEN